MDDEAITVELCYSQPRRGARGKQSSARRVLVRSVETGQTLIAVAATDGADALRAAARLLAACEARSWTIARVEPFPWADEVVRGGANDAPAPRRAASRKS